MLESELTILAKLEFDYTLGAVVGLIESKVPNVYDNLLKSYIFGAQFGFINQDLSFEEISALNPVRDLQEISASYENLDSEIEKIHSDLFTIGARWGWFLNKQLP